MQTVADGNLKTMPYTFTKYSKPVASLFETSGESQSIACIKCLNRSGSTVSFIGWYSTNQGGVFGTTQYAYGIQVLSMGY